MTNIYCAFRTRAHIPQSSSKRFESAAGKKGVPRSDTTQGRGQAPQTRSLPDRTPTNSTEEQLTSTRKHRDRPTTHHTDTHTHTNTHTQTPTRTQQPTDTLQPPHTSVPTLRGTRPEQKAGKECGSPSNRLLRKSMDTETPSAGPSSDGPKRSAARWGVSWLSALQQSSE